MIYLDPLFDYGWKYGPSSHLFCDAHTPLDRLHDFAQSIGLKREWFQSQSRMPHYDVNKRRRALAVRNGAIEIGRQRMVEIMRGWKEKSAINNQQSAMGTDQPLLL